MMEKYKSMQQLDSEMRLCSPQCFCDGSCKKPRKSLIQRLDEQDLQNFLKEVRPLPLANEDSSAVNLISVKKDKTEEIKQLISSTPNDFELGRLIREMYSK